MSCGECGAALKPAPHWPGAQVCSVDPVHDIYYDDDPGYDEHEPMCDHCGRMDYEASPHHTPPIGDDWNAITGNHKSCDYEYLMKEAIDGA